MTKKHMIYKYESFDSMETNVDNTVNNCQEDEYGHFIDLEDMEPVEIVEYYVVKSMCRGDYDVCRKSVKNPKYMRRIIHMEMEEIDDESDTVMDICRNTKTESKTYKGRMKGLFRFFCRQAYVTIIGITISVLFLCNMKNTEVEEMEMAT